MAKTKPNERCGAITKPQVGDQPQNSRRQNSRSRRCFIAAVVCGRLAMTNDIRIRDLNEGTAMGSVPRRRLFEHHFPTAFPRGDAFVQLPLKISLCGAWMPRCSPMLPSSQA